MRARIHQMAQTFGIDFNSLDNVFAAPTSPSNSDPAKLRSATYVSRGTFAGLLVHYD
eukprot:CAMPEP_0182889772 /NCGR_PEP_ID=MMETSP0034_2-20130328/22246_1 /TAXON_ID=156128 /ORGANISM="Nephroselmis pyriformis, Strain CCMP717" /LENGTH=56 /DNA_ID=CAMNT_0025023289 /DNA_START=27 /DNA_END=197 /DNA_ORIENTATION=+